MEGNAMGDDRMATTQQKALEINLDPLFYGSIAEIGAGQEVARHFFQAGGASKTVAKALSAYDMQFSDAIYGPESSGRYVTLHRLESMLDTEYRLALDRLISSRPAGSRFFAFADTVVAKQYRKDNECHGFMGIRFQHEPGSEPSTVVIHVRMFDSSNRGQQEALGLLGVNLVHAAYRFGGDCGRFVDSLMDGIVWGRVELDYIDLHGPCFDGVDIRLANLRLVTSSLGPVVMFGPDGRVVLPAEFIHGKDVMILRGTFRPFLPLHSDMIRQGLSTFAARLGEPPSKIATFCEMNVARYISEGLDEAGDLPDRVQAITSAGHFAMVTSHLRYFRLSEYFSRHVKRRIGFLLSVDNIKTIFDDRYYEGLEGGILEAMGKLFASDSVLLVHPILTREGEVITADTVHVADDLRYLYMHLLHNGRIIHMQRDVSVLVPFGS